MLSRLGVEEINREAYIAQKAAMVTNTGVPGWFSNLGDLIAEYLPTFIQIFNSLRTAQGAPTVAQFFARGHKMLSTEAGAPPLWVEEGPME